MSHFTATVVVSKQRLATHGSVGDAVNAMLAPYNENADEVDPSILTFKDEEDEMLTDYQEKPMEAVRLANGTLVSKYDNRLKNDRREHFAVPCSEVYATFDEYADKFCGYKRRDPKTGRYGYWKNPQAKWDWYSIGGRWMGFFPVKPGARIFLGRAGAFDNKPTEGGSDICRIGDLDWERITDEMNKRAIEFWDAFVVFREHGKHTDPEKNEPFGVRSTALDMGLCQVVRDEAEGKRLGGFRWGDQNAMSESDERRNWYDVYSDIDQETFFRNWLEYFCPIRSYAILNDDGWHQPGEMGWWGCDSATSESRREYAQSFLGKFIRDVDPESLLVVVDCHI